jgi:hypothetical protein
MTGQILRNLLDSQQRLFIPGLGLFTAEARSSEIQFGAGTISPPSVRIEFSQRSQDASNELRDHLVNQYSLLPSRAEELLDGFVAEVRRGLSADRKFAISGFGTLAYDVEGNVQFLPLEGQPYCLSSFGLKSIAARSISLRNRLSEDRETPVIPLRPFDEPITTKNPWRPNLAYAAVAAGLALAAGSIIWLSTLGPEAGQQASVFPLQAETEISSKASAPVAAGSEELRVTSPAATEPQPELDYYVVAGSFRHSDIAAGAEKSWKSAGFQTSFHSLPEKEMTRVSIGRFSSKEDALAFLQKSQAGFTAQLWILKEAASR